MARVKVLKAHLGQHGAIVQAGAEIECDVQRHRALARNGIVPWPDGEGPTAAGAAPGQPGVITNKSFKPRRSRVVEQISELKQDGPTVEAWVEAGYRASNYPPRGYESKSSAAEIEAAIAAQAAAERPPIGDKAGGDKTGKKNSEK